MAKPSSKFKFFSLLDQLFTGKIRIRLLTKLLLNPAAKVYLRGLERELDVSSNTVRLELGKLSEMHLIEVDDKEGHSKVKHYGVNTQHPLFNSLRSIILKYVGLDQILEKVVGKLGNLKKVYLTGSLAEGKNTQVIDLILVGDIDKAYLHQLVDKVEPMIGKKIRTAIFADSEFGEEQMNDLGVTINLLEH